MQGTLDAIESHKTDKLPSDKAKNLIAQFIDSIESDNLDIKKFILSEFIEKSIVNETPGDIDIIWNF